MKEIVRYTLPPEKEVIIEAESDAEPLCVTHYGRPTITILGGVGPHVMRKFIMLNRGHIPDNAKFVGVMPIEVPQSGGQLTELYVFEVIGGV